MGDPAPAPDNNEHQGPPSPAASAQPSMTVHPITISGVPMHMYPCSRGPTSTPPTRTKRRQVKNACTNCQKACKKCDDARPCLRCVTYGLQDECVDSQRKERQKGIKRGPYKKRDGRLPASGNAEHQLEVTMDGGMVIPSVVAGVSQPIPYVGPVGYPPTVYSQYPVASTGKPGEAPVFYPQAFYFPFPVPAPHPPHGLNQEADANGYPPAAHQYYPATFLTPYPPQAYPQYIMPSPQVRPDTQPPMQPSPHHVAAHRYAPYPQMYTRHTAAPAADAVPSHMTDNRRDARMEHGRAQPGEGMLGAAR
ncbi:hypothetical protein CERSUDRAFT_113870 [Gelatoporia subvermispora B]|uniref:Transcription activator of gluconeogenesis ERT1 n=1 Tax=Ceriporiopsis subvermispora (strain B) TaxID=914234 RepID=M2QNR6_CERS8|nr:hypothetical protein CERSUDRAFT_113870 [Gelatoporia subvermispora B]